MPTDTPLVSIIIPTYNRAHLIGETLDSVLAQTYQNWECIVVDDGSSDATANVMEGYIAKDTRFKYYHRPSEHLPGGNGARNYGLKRAEGDYIIFFDSDDLMTADHLEVKMNAIKNTNFDYVITKTKFFESLDPWIEERYKGIKEQFSVKNFILQEISWLTPDCCIKTTIAKSINFNEVIHSGQEFNYFSKLVLKSVNAIFIENYVTLRRVHETSIRSGLAHRDAVMVSAYTSCWFTYKDIKQEADGPIRKALLMRCVEMDFRNRHIRFPHQAALVIAVFKEFGVWLGINFICMKFFNTYFNKGYMFRKNLVRRLEKDNLQAL